MAIFGIQGDHGLDSLGVTNFKNAFWNLKETFLIEEAIKREEGVLSPDGALIVNTGVHTGRSPNDKYVTKYSESDDGVWWGKVNQPLTPEKFGTLFIKCKAYLQGKDIFIEDLAAGADPDYRLPIRVISEKAWASLFARNLFIIPKETLLKNWVPEYTLIHCPGLFADPSEDGTNSGTFIALDFHRRLIIIGGTSYAGEIKKSIFTVMNYLLPEREVLPMHCSANIGKDNDVSLFFGLSGTGKTTLSSDSDRQLIGDDEHGWSPKGIFNFEGGCYAKTIRLNEKLEPLIWSAVHRFGTVLENVDYTLGNRKIDFDSEKLTENTRAAYPLEFIPGYLEEGYAGHPTNVFFLSADAFGVLPPISLLSPEQAMYYFLSGYTAKLAGTEKGLGSEPQATFSTCFGAPFLPLFPKIYAKLLGKRINEYKSHVWLVNTGWTGGPYGIGSRINLPYTRALIKAALSGALQQSEFQTEPFFGLNIPKAVPGVPSEILLPENTWGNKEEYKKAAVDMVARFKKNFTQFENEIEANIVLAGPR